MLYCVSAAKHETLAPPAHEPVPRAVSADGLVGFVADSLVTGGGEGIADVEAALHFGQIVEHYHRQATVVPMRYGCRLPDEAAVTRHLQQHGQRYRRLLERLDDCVEMSLRRPLPKRVRHRPVIPISGRDYLRSRQQEFAAAARRAEWLDEIDAVLKGLYRERRSEQGPFAGRQMLSTHYLVPRPQVAAFQRTIEEWAGDRPRTDLLVSGPWPPYTFATDVSGASD